MLPTFKIIEWQGRFAVETDWYVDAPDLGQGAKKYLMVTTSGVLSTSGVSWGTRAKAEENIERCKRRLRA